MKADMRMSIILIASSEKKHNAVRMNIEKGKGEKIDEEKKNLDWSRDYFFYVYFFDIME